MESLLESIGLCSMLASFFKKIKKNTLGKIIEENSRYGKQVRKMWSHCLSKGESWTSRCTGGSKEVIMLSSCTPLYISSAPEPIAFEFYSLSVYQFTNSYLFIVSWAVPNIVTLFLLLNSCNATQDVWIRPFPTQPCPVEGDAVWQLNSCHVSTQRQLNLCDD